MAMPNTIEPISDELSFFHHFSSMKDPRIDRQKEYSLNEILFLVFSASVCGITDFVHVEDFGSSRLEWHRKFFPYKKGIPSHDTLGRVMSMVCPDAFKECFVSWTTALQKQLKEIIAIDGKCLRHSYDNANGKAAIYMVSAWACEQKLVLGQEKVADKSNEITAIPELLHLLDVSGAIVTIDAMGCQKDIAALIIKKKADFVLSLKGNQGSLHEDITLFFEEQSRSDYKDAGPDYYEEVDKDHGRIETRKCWVIDEIDWLTQHHQWKGLRSIAKVESTREIDGELSTEIRYFITSLPKDAKLILHAIRSHWGIENSLHWVLDVQFKEDYSRVRTKHATQNMAIVRHMAMNIINQFKAKNKNMSVKRVQCKRPNIRI